VLPQAAVDMRLLDALLRTSEPTAMPVLAGRLNASASRVRQALESLRASGCIIERDPARGVRLLEAGLGVWSDYLATIGRVNRPRNVSVYQRTGSTQDVARQLLLDLGPNVDGAVVAANEQTEGRGRLGRTWQARPGDAVLLSRVALVEAPTRQAAVERVTLAAAVATAKAVEAIAPTLGVEVRWPNDLYVGEKKLAGILVEVTASSGGPIGAVIGLGINVKQSGDALADAARRLRRPITSLTAEGAAVDRLRVAGELVTQLDAWMAASDAQCVEAWRGFSRLLGRTITLWHDGRSTRGEVLDLDPVRGLIVRQRDGAIGHFPAATTSVG